MKRCLLLIAISLLVIGTPSRSEAQIPIAEIIKQGIKRVIKAVDLQVQRIQNKTIWLQNAQKVLENNMSKLRLDEITNWVQKQKELYSDFYTELWEVKNVIAYYHSIRDITTQQLQLLSEYRRVWHLLKKDQHFNSDEIAYMAKVYGGILEATGKNIDQLLIVVHSFATQMSDAKRLDIINSVADNVKQHYSDLTQFNSQNALLALQRAKSQDDAEMIKWMYGLGN